MLVSADAAAGIDADIKLFFLQWTKETSLPEPDANAAGHHAICLCESDFALQVGFCRVVYVKDYARLVGVKICPHRCRKITGLGERRSAGHVELHGRFREGAKEIFISDAGSQQAGQD